MENLMSNMLTDALLIIMLFCMIGVLSIRLYRIYLWFKNKYKSYKAYKKSDKRTFDCSEIVWFNKHKFYIESCNKWSHTLDIDLTLRPVEYNLSFLDTKVDSRAVKKVVRMYAELGDTG